MILGDGLRLTLVGGIVGLVGIITEVTGKVRPPFQLWNRRTL